MPKTKRAAGSERFPLLFAIFLAVSYDSPLFYVLYVSRSLGRPMFLSLYEVHIKAVHDEDLSVILIMYVASSLPPSPFSHSRQWCHLSLLARGHYLWYLAKTLILSYVDTCCGRYHVHVPLSVSLSSNRSHIVKHFKHCLNTVHLVFWFIVLDLQTWLNTLPADELFIIPTSASLQLSHTRSEYFFLCESITDRPLVIKFRLFTIPQCDQRTRKRGLVLSIVLYM